MRVRKFLRRRERSLLLLSLVSLIALALVFADPLGPPMVKAATEYYTVFSVESSNTFIYAYSYTSYLEARNAMSGELPVPLEEWVTVGQFRSDCPYWSVSRTCLPFDTHSLPETANITEAKLGLRVHYDESDTDFSITIQNGQPTYPHIPVVESDFYHGYYSGAGGSLSTSGMSEGNYYNITLSADGISWIKTADVTKLCLRSSRDINSNEPTENVPEYVDFDSAQGGESVSPKLYVTYELEVGFSYLVHGPFYEDGSTASAAVTVTLEKTEAAPQSWTLNGSDGYDTLDISVEHQGVLFSWNVTGYNATRAYYLTDATFEEIWIFLTDPNQPTNVYYFSVIDYVGVTNGYVETIINVNGTNRVVERWSIGILSDIPFTLGWNRKYDIKLTCDEGTHIWPGFQALGDPFQQLLIMPGMFPITYPGMNVTANAKRMNETWIQVNYTDNQESTPWIEITISYKQGYSWVTAYSTVLEGGTQQLNWYSADEDTDYTVNVEAMRNPNLIENPGYEYGTWGGSEAHTSGYSKFGTYSVRLQASGSPIYAGHSNYIDIQGMETITVSAWVKVTEYTAGIFPGRLYYRYENTTIISFEYIWIVEAIQAFTQYSLSKAIADMPTGTRYLSTTFLWTSTPTGKGYVDGWQLGEPEIKSWTFSCPALPTTTNPWEDLLDAIGTWPIPSKNIIGLFLVLIFFGIFSYRSMPLGCVVGVIIAAFLTYIGWLDLSWNLIALAGAIAVFAAIAQAKREEREI